MNRFYTTLSLLAVILAPVAMMSILGWETYSQVLAVTATPWLALISGVATAGLLEAIGIVAGETALVFHARRDPRWRVAAAVLLLYVLTGLLLLWRTPLVLLPVLAGSVYILVGLRAQAARETAAQTTQASAAAEWEQEQWRIRQADRTQLKLAELQAKQAAPQLPASSLQASTNGASKAASAALYRCKQCEQTFTNMQALGGHVRHTHRSTP